MTFWELFTHVLDAHWTSLVLAIGWFGAVAAFLWNAWRQRQEMGVTAQAVAQKCYQDLLSQYRADRQTDRAEIDALKTEVSQLREDYGSEHLRAETLQVRVNELEESNVDLQDQVRKLESKLATMGDRAGVRNRR